MPELKCVKCHKLLAEVDITHGKVEIKCKCGTLNTMQATPTPKDVPYVQNQPYQQRMGMVHK